MKQFIYNTIEKNNGIALSVETEELLETIIVGNSDTELPAKVILFNDEWHSFDEVIAQVIKAIHCSYQKAEDITLDVHNKGKAIVYEGEMLDCLRVSSVLEEIALHTQIEY
jgi:ATP-dependent Clp protease adaptor protein ClpS